MFTTTKNSTRLENLDHDAMMCEARAERARYLTLLFNSRLAVARQFVPQLLPASRSTRRKMGIGLFLIMTVLLIGWGLVPMARAQNNVIFAGCRFDAQNGGLIGTSAEIRAAIQTANSQPGPDTILLAPNCIYTLDQDYINQPADGLTNLPYITQDLTIEGFDARLIRPNSRLPYRMFLVDGVRLTIKDVTLENGRELNSGYGGAIRVNNNGTLILENVTLIGNKASVAGGAIYAGPGDLEVRNSHFEDNQLVSVQNPTRGGAIAGVGDFDIADSKFVNNQATTSGGALQLSGVARIEHNEFINNRTPAGSGGAINLGLISDNVSIERNKFFNNEAFSGGGIYVSDPSSSPSPTLGHVSVHNNLWVNQRAEIGTHLFLHVIGNGAKSFTVHHNTFVGTKEKNAAAAYLFQAVHPDGTLLPTRIFNNIVVGHRIGLRNAGPYAIAGKRNLFFDNQTHVAGDFPQVAPIFADPQFVNPANGDYHLKAGSDAVDTGTDTLPIILDLDGVNRQLHGPVPDIGAYEFVVKNPQNGPGDGTVFLPLVVK